VSSSCMNVSHQPFPTEDLYVGGSKNYILYVRLLLSRA
jgi:hypothetical protein